MKDKIIDILLNIFGYSMLTFVAGAFIGGFFVIFTGVNNRVYELENKIIYYEKILNREYGRNFESYEDYLLYKIEIEEDF